MDPLLFSLQEYLIEKWYEHIMETLKGTQWIIQYAGCFAVTDGDIVLRPINSNFNKRGPCTLFFLPNIVSITISCNAFTHLICSGTLWNDWGSCMRMIITLKFLFSISFWLTSSNSNSPQCPLKLSSEKFLCGILNYFLGFWITLWDFVFVPNVN